MALHAAFRQQLGKPTVAPFKANVVLTRPLRLSRAQAGQQQRAPSPTSTDTAIPEACAMQILQLWQERKLEALLPFMSELAVVKAVVR